MCKASHFSLIVGIILILLTVFAPFGGAAIRKLAEADLEDVRRKAEGQGLLALAFRLGYPLVWALYLPNTQGFFKTIALGLLLMSPPLLFC